MKRLIAGAALSALMSFPAAAQDADTVLATVNGTEITLGHMIAMRELLPEQYQQLPDEVLFNGMLEQLVQQQVLADSASEDLSLAIRLGLENERRAFLAASVVSEISAEPISADDLQAEYDAIYGSAEPAMEYNASHILVETEEEANALIAELEGGADFAELAQQHSTGPSGPNGGQLGWFAAGMMVPEFEQAVFDLEVGAVSGGVQTQFGWHVIILNETRDQAAPALEDVQAELEDALRVARSESLMEELTGAATIDRPELDIDVALIRNLELLSE